MKITKCSLFILYLSLFAFILFVRCGEDNDPDSQPCEVTNTCNDNGDNDNDNGNNTTSAITRWDVTNPEGFLESIGVIGLNKDNIKTDNPSLDVMLRSGGKGYYLDDMNDVYAGKINMDAAFITVAVQNFNSNKDVYNIPSVPSDYSYKVIVFVPASDALGLVPNAVIRGSQNVVLNIDGQQNDGNIPPQAIIPLTSGEFTIDVINNTHALWRTSSDEMVQSQLCTVSPEDFSRSADGVLVSTGEGLNAFSLIEDIFNQEEIEICILEVVSANILRSPTYEVIRPYEL